ncbi:DUF2336 domain-containing protein [Ahrensia marina]|uniref:DUF2336 domain-containing protein n=1 Tax=Ahrensia marina TaxID=1514904 RepID=A0A0M9GNA6_9HYPH|nr:DUF2336 domain-containing protein [Ahrensia marina]KPB01476.1 hypothetical protein SU32_07770 [Ahrensia marina]
MIIQHFLQWKDSANVLRRQSAASALGRAYLQSDLSFEDRCAAEAAITLLLDDPSEKVRYALADALCTSANAPMQVINAFVDDQFDIASLVIARSPILLDRDLVARVRTAEERLQVVIANRPHVSNVLAKAIATLGGAEACVALLNNFNADVCGECRSLIANRHCSTANVRGALLKQKDLEADIRLKIMKAAANAMASSGLFGMRRKAEVSNHIVHEAQQRALVHMVGSSRDTNVDSLIDSLRESGDLTTQLLIRTACYGKMDFLARVLSSLSGETPSRVTSILVKERKNQLRALLAGAGFSEAVQPVFEYAISLWRDVAQGKLVAGAQEITREIMERFEESAAGSAHMAANDDIMSLLRSIYLDAMRDNARKHAVALTKAA